MVHISILHVGNIQPWNIAVIAKYSIVGVRGDDAALKEFLADDGGEGVGCDLGVNVNQPRKTWSCLEEKLSSSTATRLQVDEGSDALKKGG